MDRDNLKPVIESLIFASEEAVTIARLSNILEGVERKAIRAAVDELAEEYRGRGGGFFIDEVAGGYQFRTTPEFAPWIKKLFKTGPRRLSRAALETLSIVAYRQPLTRGEIEAVRGVDSGGVLATLLDKRLIKITGRKNTPGRPAVYSTTKEFLETFELNDLASLPSLKEIESPGEEEEEKKDVVEERAEERPTETGEAAESDSGGRNLVEAQGRGADNRGPGEGQRGGGGETGDAG
ncbi:MAG: SMC-Scp complex subunit ScpB [Thermodesulfobacteriota bacterium]